MLRLVCLNGSPGVGIGGIGGVVWWRLAVCRGVPPQGCCNVMPWYVLLCYVLPYAMQVSCIAKFLVYMGETVGICPEIIGFVNAGFPPATLRIPIRGHIVCIWYPKIFF